MKTCVECGKTENEKEIREVGIDKTDRCYDCEQEMVRAYDYLSENSTVFRNCSMDEQGRISTELGRMLIKAKNRLGVE